MRKTGWVIFISLMVVGVAAYAGESMLDYFKGRKPAVTPLYPIDTIPILQNHTAVRMGKPDSLRPWMKNMTTGWNNVKNKPTIPVVPKRIYGGNFR